MLDKKITLMQKNAVFSINNEVINLAELMGKGNLHVQMIPETVIVECAFFCIRVIFLSFNVQTLPSSFYFLKN